MSALTLQKPASAMDYLTSVKQLGHGSHYRKERQRSPDFWEVVRGCGIGLECDDVHSHDDVVAETIFVPETLWSDLPAVHVGAEWEPVEWRTQPRIFSRNSDPLADGVASEHNAPPPMALRWDSAHTNPEAPDNATSRHAEHLQARTELQSLRTAWLEGSTSGMPPSSSRIAAVSSRAPPAPHSSSSSSSSQCTGPQRLPAAVLSTLPKRSPATVANAPPPLRSVPVASARVPRRSPVSKGADEACLPDDVSSRCKARKQITVSTDESVAQKAVHVARIGDKVRSPRRMSEVLESENTEGSLAPSLRKPPSERETDGRRLAAEDGVMGLLIPLHFERDYANASNPQSGDAGVDGESSSGCCTLTSSSIEV